MAYLGKSTADIFEIHFGSKVLLAKSYHENPQLCIRDQFDVMQDEFVYHMLRAAVAAIKGIIPVEGGVTAEKLEYIAKIAYPHPDKNGNPANPFSDRRVINSVIEHCRELGLYQSDELSP